MSLLLFGAMVFASPVTVAPVNAQLAPPSIFSGRRRGWQPKRPASVMAAAPDGSSVAVRCKEEAPSIFSGRTKARACPLEEVNPRFRSVAPAIFSGRAPQRGNVIVGQAAFQPITPRTITATPQGNYVITGGYTATGDGSAISVQQPTRRRAPSIFSGRRAPRKPAQ